MTDGYGIKENGEFYKVSLQFGSLRLCGSGRFSNVYYGQLTSPIRKEVAIKNAWSDKDNRNTASTDYAEVQILSKLFHPAISNLCFFYSKEADDKKIFCLVLDYLPQELAKLRAQGMKFDILDAKIFTFQLFCAIAHLASRNIVHMDVKPHNIILDKSLGLLKLADFGNARRLDTAEKTGDPYQVTRFYRPPELLFGCEKFTPAIDVWSATCVAFELLANQVLFRGKDTKDQIVLITGVFGYPTDEDIRSMGVRRPRVARKEARGIEKFTSNLLDADTYNFLKSTLKIDPLKRKSAEDVLKAPLFNVIREGPRLKRSNGVEMPDLSQYTEMRPKREISGEKVPEKSSSSKEESDKEN